MILIFVLLGGYGYRSGNNVLAGGGGLEQRRRRVGFWCGAPFGPDHCEEVYNG